VLVHPTNLDIVYAAALGHATRDGLSLPAGANLTFSQTDPDLRTNTDARMTNGSGSKLVINALSATRTIALGPTAKTQKLIQGARREIRVLPLDVC